MYKQLGITVIVVAGLIFAVGFFGGLANHQNQVAKNEVMPTLPVAYTAQPVVVNTGITTPPTPTPPTGPPNIFGAVSNVTPTTTQLACASNGGTCGLLNENSSQVNSQIVSYLTQTQNYTNETNVFTETEFWNSVSATMEQKMDSTNPSVISFTNSQILPNDTGTYNVTQISDVWNYVEPRAVENYNTNETEIATNNPNVWTESIQSADQYLANNFTGVCSDYAVFMASANIALGGNSRLIYTVNPSDSSEAHMYAEAEFNDTSFVPIIQQKYSLPNTTTINYHSASIATQYPPPGNWLSLDWFNYPNPATYPGGNFYPNSGYLLVIYDNGDWEKISTTTSPWQVILYGP